MKKEIGIYSGTKAAKSKILSCDRKINDWHAKRDLRLNEWREIVKTNIQNLITDPVHKDFFKVETLGDDFPEDTDRSFLQEIVRSLVFKRGKLEFSGKYRSFHFDKEVLEKSGFNLTEEGAIKLAADISTDLKGVMTVKFSDFCNSEHDDDFTLVTFKVYLVIE